MNLQTIQAAILQAVAAASGVPASRVAWSGAREAATWRSAVLIDLTLTGPSRVAWDEERTVYDEDTDELVLSLVGPRELRVDVKIESLDQTPGASAHQTASTLITRLQRASVQALLDAVGVSLATTSRPVNMDYKSDGRMVSVVIVELLFNAIEVDLDTTFDGERVEHFTFESESFINPDGTLGPQVSLIVPPLPEEEV